MSLIKMVMESEKTPHQIYIDANVCINLVCGDTNNCMVSEG